jgi:hypothetical protein
LLEYLAIGELPKNIVSGGGAIEDIFAGLEGTTGMAASIKLKGDGTAHDTFSLEKARDGTTGRTVGHFDEDALAAETLVRVINGIPEPCGGSRSDQHNKKYQLSHRLDSATGRYFALVI